MAITDRIVKRRNLKEELARLRMMFRVSQPLIEATQKLNAAYQAGYKKRLEEEIEEEKIRAAGVPPPPPDVVEAEEETLS